MMQKVIEGWVPEIESGADTIANLLRGYGLSETKSVGFLLHPRTKKIHVTITVEEIGKEDGA